MWVYLEALGCRLNEAEVQVWQREFQHLGHRIASRPDDSDLVVINTCAVTSEAARKSRRLLRRAHRINPEARLVVSGCYASLEPSATAELHGIDLIIPNERKDQLVSETLQRLSLPLMPQLAEQDHPLFGRTRQRAFIKIQDGCRYQCSFCIVTRARGEERSRTIEEVVHEVHRLADDGVEEAVLSGVHLGGYGSDLGYRLSDLIDAILSHTDLPRLRLGALEPWDLDDNFWRCFDNPRLMPHLHLPLQSGCSRTLKRMARRCRPGEFARLVEIAHSCNPIFNITTDIIVGFPGEDEDEWRESRDFIARQGFGHLHIFAFSPREGTRAATMPDPVATDQIRERSAEMHAIGQRMKRDVLQRQIGKGFELLVEKQEQPDASLWSGYTPNFHRALLQTAPGNSLKGKRINARITGLDEKGEQLIARQLD